MTPADKGRTQDLTFSNGNETAAVAASGEEVALKSTVPFGPNPSLGGARAVFSRNPVSGWEMHSVLAPGASAREVTPTLFSADLSQVALESQIAGLNFGEKPLDEEIEVGPVGGPDAVVASIPRKEVETSNTQFLGATADFSHVLFVSIDHALPLRSNEEETAAEATDHGARDLYDWSGKHLQLVNVRENGSLVNRCGAFLGAGATSGENFDTVNAVSEDGSKVFFTSPYNGTILSEPGCQEPARLYMRVDGDEPVEVSTPEPEAHPSKNLPVRAVRYNYATPDGSKVFFNTETVFTRRDAEEQAEQKLFEYDPEAPEGKRLRRIANGVPRTIGVGSQVESYGFVFSEDGSTVYIESKPNATVHEIYRLDTKTTERVHVATAYVPPGVAEPSYSTPNGEFFLFTSRGVKDPGEPRGAGPNNELGNNELYRYDRATGSVMCVTCGTGNAPAQGEVIDGKNSTFGSSLTDDVPRFDADLRKRSGGVLSDDRAARAAGHEQHRHWTEQLHRNAGLGCVRVGGRRRWWV